MIETQSMISPRLVHRPVWALVVFVLAAPAAADKPIWSVPGLNRSNVAVVQVADTAIEEPPAPAAAVGDGLPGPAEYEPTPADALPVEPLPAEAEPANTSDGVAGVAPLMPLAPAGPLPVLPYADPVYVGGYSGSVRMACGSCPRCASQKRRCWCCWEDELDARCISGAEPHGAALRATFGAQIARADASQMILYEYDFVPGRPELNLRGQYQLAKLADRATRCPFPIVVQATPAVPMLAEARHARVIEHLQASGWAEASSRVVIGLPMSPGLHGLDALPIAERLPYASVGGGMAAGAGGSASATAPPVGP